MTKKSKITKGIYGCLQWSWGVLQTAAGLAVFLLHARQRHFFYHGALVTVWEKNAGVSLGWFVFTAAEPNGLLVHEYGHTVQSLILGPLYLIVVGIPSAVWGNLPYFRRKRKERNIPYTAFFTEEWADRLGEKVTGQKALGGGAAGSGRIAG